MGQALEQDHQTADQNLWKEYSRGCLGSTGVSQRPVQDDPLQTTSPEHGRHSMGELRTALG